MKWNYIGYFVCQIFHHKPTLTSHFLWSFFNRWPLRLEIMRQNWSWINGMARIQIHQTMEPKFLLLQNMVQDMLYPANHSITFVIFLVFVLNHIQCLNLKAYFAWCFVKYLLSYQIFLLRYVLHLAFFEKKCREIKWFWHRIRFSK